MVFTIDWLSSARRQYANCGVTTASATAMGERPGSQPHQGQGQQEEHRVEVDDYGAAEVGHRQRAAHHQQDHGPDHDPDLRLSAGQSGLRLQAAGDQHQGEPGEGGEQRRGPAARQPDEPGANAVAGRGEGVEGAGVHGEHAEHRQCTGEVHSDHPRRRRRAFRRRGGLG
jgi:hypothetical protein